MRSEGKEQHLTAFQYVVAGGATGTLTRFLVQPLDVLKITFQLQITPLAKKDSAKYTSVFQAIRIIVKEEGIYGMWKGHIPAQCLSVIYGAIQFSTYEQLTNYFYNKNPLYFTSKEHIINIGCGAFAGLSATILSFPFDVIKTHLVYQSNPRIYNGSFDVVKKVYQSHGAKGFTKGMLAAAIQTTPMSGLVFFFHGIFSQAWLLVNRKMDSEHNFLSTAGNIITGLGAGLCSKAIVYPYDLMKKRLQIQGLDVIPYSDKEILRCNNIRECFTLTVKTEGFLGLFKGFTPTLVKSGATTSLYFTIYSKMCDFIRYHSSNKS